MDVEPPSFFFFPHYKIKLIFSSFKFFVFKSNSKWNSNLCLKGSVQFLFLCNLKKSYAQRTYNIFFVITQIAKKILTTERFCWLELITVVLSLLKIFNMKPNKKTQISYFGKIVCCLLSFDVCVIANPLHTVSVLSIFYILLWNIMLKLCVILCNTANISTWTSN